MIKDWRVDEDGVYFITVEYKIVDVLTWHVRDRIEFYLTDAACDEAMEYLKDWRDFERNDYTDFLDGEIAICTRDCGPVFSLVVRIEPDREDE